MLGVTGSAMYILYATAIHDKLYCSFVYTECCMLKDLCRAPSLDLIVDLILPSSTALPTGYEVSSSC